MEQEDKYLKKFEEYLKGEEKSPLTLEKYLREAGCFFDWRKERGTICDVSRQDVISYKEYLIGRGYKAATINGKLSALRVLFKSMGKDLKIKNLKRQYGTYADERRILTKKDYERLLRAANRDEKTKLILQSICSAGIRVSELKYFTMESLREGRVLIRNKGKERVILIPEKLLQCICG